MKKNTTEQLAAGMVDRYFSQSAGLHDIIECDPEGFATLLDSAGVPSQGEIVTMEEQIQAALPVEMRGMLKTYSDLCSRDATAHMEACFALGAAYVIRMAGGAR